jgi:hypothetical protein
VLDMLINVPQLLLRNEHRARGPAPQNPRATAACPLAARASPPSPPDTPKPHKYTLPAFARLKSRALMDHWPSRTFSCTSCRKKT